MQMHLYWVSTITYAIILGILLYSDIVANRENDRLKKSFFLMTGWVLFFCVQDTVWGMCDSGVIKSSSIFFISSSVFHMSTVITTFFWLKYVLEYLGERVRHKKVYLALDGMIICLELVLVAVNFKVTTLFTIENGEYVTGILRPLSFVNQYIVYLIIGIIALFLAAKRDTSDSKRYRIVFLFALAPILLGIFQLMFPDAPFYSLGYFMGCFIVHIFIVAKDREIYSDQEAQMKKILELNKQLEEKQNEIDEQFGILKSISGVYDCINLLDFRAHTALRFDKKDSEAEPFDIENSAHTSLNRRIAGKVDDNDYDRFWEYTDLSTLEERMKGKKLISAEFKYSDGDWIRANYIRVDDNVKGPLKQVAYALRNISSDRKREEQVYSAMANLVYSLHVFDLDNDTVERLIETDTFRQLVGNEESGRRMANKLMQATCKDEYLDIMLDFVDFSTINKRLKGKKSISCEFVGKYHGWTRMTFIPIVIKNNQVKKMLITTQIIDSEKNEMINLLYQSSTDGLTRLYNRRMYEEELDKLAKDGKPSDVIIIAMDVNGLKGVNDSLGHKAGDELIIGASECTKKAFTGLGKIYRTGGDEFMAILKCDEEELNKQITAFEQLISNWSGNMVNSLSISYGIASVKDYPNLTVRELASEADKRMYEAKAEYYRQSGIDRRK